MRLLGAGEHPAFFLTPLELHVLLVREERSEFPSRSFGAFGLRKSQRWIARNTVSR